MNRTLSVSTDVYAAIWAARHPGEENENAILARLLGCRVDQSTPKTTMVSSDGFYDNRNGVHFDEGFEIFRTYKGKEYSAIAVGGSWRRTDNGQSYTSLNQLNGSITAGAENVWNGNWKFRDANGTIQSIDKLRN